jgi:hypothetical protein
MFGFRPEFAQDQGKVIVAVYSDPQHRDMRLVMFRLMMLLYSIVGTTLAGIGVVVAVTMNMYDVQSIIVSAAIGAILALPVCWVVAKKLQEA